MTHASRRTSTGWLPSFAIVILGTALLAGCGPDPSEMVKESRELAERFSQAFNSEDLDAIMATYWNDPSLVSMPPGQMILKGPDSVREDFKNFFDGTKVKSFTFKSQEFRAHGDVVISWGTFKLVTAPSLGPEVSIEGRYTDVTGERDGEWVYLLDHASLPINPKALATPAKESKKKGGR